MMQQTLILCATLGALTFPLDAQRGRGGDPTQVWQFLAGNHDKDKDGKITAKEYGRGADKFAAHDKNGDGVITLDDFTAGGGGRARGRARNNRAGAGRNRSDFGRLLGGAIARTADGDRDSKVTLAEWTTRTTAIDADKNGKIEPGEIRSLVLAAMGRKQLSDRAIARRARRLDTNRDGALQLGEVAALFAKLDADNNQWLAPAEFASSQPLGAPRVGDLAPDFELPFVADDQKLVKLSAFRGKKPVALIFGSYT